MAVIRKWNVRNWYGTEAESLSMDTSLCKTLDLYFATNTDNVYKWDGSAWEAVGGGGAADPSIFINGVVLTQGNWSLVSGLYEYDYANDSFLADSVVNVVPINDSMTTVQTAVMYPLITVSVGSIKMYCQNAPGGDITINITVGV